MLKLDDILAKANEKNNSTYQKERQLELKPTSTEKKEEQTGKLNINDVLGRAFGGGLPFDITQYYYNTIEPRTGSYSQHAENVIDALKPSDNWQERLSNIFRNASVLQNEGRAVFDYAAETGQSTKGALASISTMRNLMNNVKNAAKTIGSYETDTDYLLGEKTKDYIDFLISRNRSDETEHYLDSALETCESEKDRDEILAIKEKLNF